MALPLFNYDPMLLTHQDWVRYLLGDTTVEKFEVDDREIQALLADEPEPEASDEDEEPTAAQWRGYRQRVAARAAEAIAAKYAREADVSFDQQRTALSAKFAQFMSLSKRLSALAQAAVPLKVIRV